MSTTALFGNFTASRLVNSMMINHHKDINYMVSALLVNLAPLTGQTIHDNLAAAHRNHGYYQNIGSVLLKINPCPHFSSETDQIVLMKKILRPLKNEEITAAHIYRLAGSVRRAAIDGSGTQAIILRGMNSSGKTEALKALIQYFVFSEVSNLFSSAGTNVDNAKPLGSSANPFIFANESSFICKKLITSICLISAFTSSATDRNIFSSRAMKLISLQ
jgi:myosin heavy subunit